MNRISRFVVALGLAGPAVLAQALEDPVVLTIDVENNVIYRGTVFDASKLAKDPGPTTSVNQAFVEAINIGDIVAVNGKPAKGMWSSTVYATPFRSAPQPGQMIADFDLAGTNFCTWQIYGTDGTFLGMIRDSGAGQGHTVDGALAGFFGAIGIHQTMSALTPQRQASTAEDPAKRRNLGGGKRRAVFSLYHRVRPAVQVTASGPAVFHADFSPVTPASPARGGEILMIAARNLGPTRPDMLPPGSRMFKADALEVVSSPVEVIVGGKEAEVINKVGWPGTSDLYRIDFRVPSGLAPGIATIQLTAAWIPGPAVEIPVR